jgi:hypothetical protein
MNHHQGGGGAPIHQESNGAAGMSSQQVIDGSLSDFIAKRQRQELAQYHV